MPNNALSICSPGAAEPGVSDQYADGKAALVWERFIGDSNSRTAHYRNFLVSLLRKKGCKRILDVACGTGVDSIMLLEEGFEVTSIDASDKMLKYALRTRWERRKDPAFDKWVIEEANWLTLRKDLTNFKPFDAVICLGNSFAHMLDMSGNQEGQKMALKNFEECIKPGGFLLIDHRNYDDILGGGAAPAQSIYYNSHHTNDIKTSVLYINNKPRLVTMDYIIDIADCKTEQFLTESTSEFRLCYYPHRLHDFSRMLQDTFGNDFQQTIFADFKRLEEVETPGFYIHLVEKH